MGDCGLASAALWIDPFRPLHPLGAHMTIRGKDGWPVEMIEGKPVTNFLRRIIHGNIRKTWMYRRKTQA
jgi:hypothetical protein